MLRMHNLWPVTSFELIRLAFDNSLVKLRDFIESHCGFLMHWPVVGELALSCSAEEVQEEG